MRLSFQEALLATWKRCLSFRKNKWELADYPVVVREQQISNDPTLDASRYVQQAYLVRIVNWWVMTGSGNTRQEAVDDLGVQFVRMRDSRLHNGKPMPRPGCEVPIEFASSDRVYAHPELTDDFIRRVLGLDWAFVSDQSSPWDFHSSGTNDVLTARIAEIYGADVSDIESGNLATILEQISSSRTR